MQLENTLVKSPKVSVIITYYNLGSYIEDCMESIFTQTYKNFEIIIVNDNSDYENSLKLNQFKKCSNVKIINLTTNKGQLGAFLEGVKIADGEFVSMIDADDILLPNYLKTLLFVHSKYNAAFVSSSCGEINSNNEIISADYVANRFNNTDKTIKYSEIENLFKTSDEFEIDILDIKKSPFGLWSWNPSSSALIRKSALKLLEFYPDVLYWKTGADKVIFSFLHLVGGSINISAILWMYRHHNSNNSNTTLTTGNKKYLSEDYIKTIIRWNIKLRLDAIKMFIKNKNQLIKIFNKVNYNKMFFRIIFCLNKKICVKILKTSTHILT